MLTVIGYTNLEKRDIEKVCSRWMQVFVDGLRRWLSKATITLLVPFPQYYILCSAQKYICACWGLFNQASWKPAHHFLSFNDIFVGEGWRFSRLGIHNKGEVSGPQRCFCSVFIQSMRERQELKNEALHFMNALRVQSHLTAALKTLSRLDLLRGSH